MFHRFWLCTSFILAFGMSGCVPMTVTYERIEAPDAVRFKDICRGTVGPPSTVYYPFHGIYISLNFASTTFGLHIPEGVTVQLNDNAIKVDGVSKSGQVQKTVHFKAFRQGAAGNDDPPEFRALPDPYTSRDNLGPYVGSSNGDRYVYYFFMGVDEADAHRGASLPFGLLYGTIELPSMTIDGHRYEPQILPFKQARFSEISPINC
jgi:hypothetical protein